MRMNWQLWTYYHRCEYKTDFWQTLFKLMREVNMTEGEDPGKKQLEFAKMASKAANENLTDFFEMWGFFEPVNSLLRNMLSSTSKTGRKVNSHRMTTVIRQSEMSDTTRNSKKTRRLPKQSRQR